MKRLLNFFGFILMMALVIAGCQKEDKVEPELTLKGKDTVTTVLNQEFEDPGFKAIDNLEGNITSRVLVQSNVNVDKVGFYEITYTVTDNSGNQSPDRVRVVKVINQANKWENGYEANDEKLYPDPSNSGYNLNLRIDSFQNYRVHLDRFYKDVNTDIFFDIYTEFEDLIIPYQEISMDTVSYWVQGNGVYTDTSFTINYTVNLLDGSELHRVELIKK
ncbi:MAG: DUF5011 domain-containing protein [Bacteroidales bacterium]|nr:DUF5011 domain-containing protein [Bacteroidales bacterium]